MTTTATPSLRKALKTLRTIDLPDWMGAATIVSLDDGTTLEAFNEPSSEKGGYLIGAHVAKRYNRSGDHIATYKI